MKACNVACAAGLFAAFLGIAPALAQQPAPAAPAFAAPDLSPAGVRSLAATCAACHGTEGRDHELRLAGVPRDLLQERMTQFRNGQLKATVMHQLAKGFTEAEIAALAQYFSALPDR